MVCVLVGGPATLSRMRHATRKAVARNCYTQTTCTSAQRPTTAPGPQTTIRTRLGKWKKLQTDARIRFQEHIFVAETSLLKHDKCSRLEMSMLNETGAINKLSLIGTYMNFLLGESVNGVLNIENPKFSRAQD